jgi:transmembrane sensor
VGTSHARRLWYSVATLAVVAAAGVVGWQAKGRLFGSNNRSTTTYATGNGQRANIHLPDGTTVVLNVASRLDVTEFTSGQRQVALQGEAYFTVAHETGAPFTVVVGKTRAKVLGTSFVVRHYAADSTTLIAVKDGRIAVHSAVVEAAQQVAVLPSGAMVRGVADPSEYTFATGTLTLAPMPLPQAIVELNRWYDADIRLGDSSLASLGVGGKFVAGSVSDLAPILEGTLGVRAVRDGNRLTLYAQ